MNLGSPTGLVGGMRWYVLPKLLDMLSKLSEGEWKKSIPNPRAVEFRFNATYVCLYTGKLLYARRINEVCWSTVTLWAKGPKENHATENIFFHTYNRSVQPHALREQGAVRPAFAQHFPPIFVDRYRPLVCGGGGGTPVRRKPDKGEIWPSNFCKSRRFRCLTNECTALLLTLDIFRKLASQAFSMASRKV